MRILRPRSKPKKAYPNSDRFEEDGRRIYSAYEGTKKRHSTASVQRARFLAIIAVTAAFVVVLAWWVLAH
jgi:hypothetical protein